MRTLQLVLALIVLMYRWVASCLRLVRLRYRSWLGSRRVIPLASAIVVDQIIIDSQDWLDAPISGAIFSELAVAQLDIPVSVGSRISVVLTNISRHIVLLRGVVMVTRDDGALVMVPLLSRTLAPNETVKTSVNTVVGGTVTRLLIPSLTTKVTNRKAVRDACS